MMLPAFPRVLAPVFAGAVLLPADWVLGAAAVHFVAAFVYAGLIWAAAVLWLLVAGGPWRLAVVLAPLVISGVAVVLMLSVAVVVAARRWLWLARSTLRLWR